MSRKRRKERPGRRQEAAKLEMTPMIDVVFQLLIFFIVTLKQEDILAHLDVSRPAAEQQSKQEVDIPDLLTITVYDHRVQGGQGFLLKGKRVSLQELDRQLTRLARYDKGVSVIIKCTADSPHSNLVRVLDVCAKAGLKNLSVFSM